MTSPFKVDFIGIGSGKCGSTWLYGNLIKHPQICANNLKELNYFSDLYEEHSLEWYMRQFGPCQENQLRGEFSVTYLAHPAAPVRIRRHFPDVKLLAIIRDPVRRTFSNYLHSIRKGDVSPRVSFAEYISHEPALAPARYYDHLVRWLAIFPREHLRIILLEEFLQDQRAGYRELFAFLGIDPEFVPPGLGEQRNEARTYRFLWIETVLVRTYRWLSRRGHTRLVKRVLDSGATELIRRLNATGAARPELDAESRARLLAYYRPHNARLARCLGRDLSLWDSGLVGTAAETSGEVPRGSCLEP